MSINKKTVKYYLADQEVGSIEVEVDESFLEYIQHKKFGFPPVEEIHCVSVLDLISKLIERIGEMQCQISENNEEIQNLKHYMEKD